MKIAFLWIRLSLPVCFDTRRMTGLVATAALMALFACAPQAWAEASYHHYARPLSSSVATGTAVTLTATVKVGATAVTSGQVNFCDAAATYCTDIHRLGTAQLTSAGTAAIKFVPAIGGHSYKAVFAGSSGNLTSSSAASALTVTGSFSTATTITPSGSAGNYTLLGTVTSVGNHPVPAGTVSFLDTSNANYTLGSTAVVSTSTVLSFLNSSTPSTGNDSYAIASADFNRDGIADLAIVNNGDDTVTILLGNGDGTFFAAASPSTGTLPYAITVADFNGDGIPDLAVANAVDGSVSVMLGNGNGTFGAATTLNVGTGKPPTSLVTADFNGDGNADIAVTDLGNNTVVFFWGDGTGNFPVTSSYSAGSTPWIIAAAISSVTAFRTSPCWIRSAKRSPC